MTDLHNNVSPLIECPCTDRITKTKIKTAIILTNGTCGNTIITSADQCMNATKDAGIVVNEVKVVNDPAQIAGCTIQPINNDLYSVIFNTDTSDTQCGTNNMSVGLIGSSTLGNLTTLDIAQDGFVVGKDNINITIRMSGPANVWFGVGFDATTMADEPYAIIVDGTGVVTERKLGNHSPGVQLNTTVTVLADSVSNGMRTVTMTRPLKGMEYCTKAGSLNVITAIGSTVDLSYHKARTGATIVLLPNTANACVCRSKVQSFITYMEQETSAFYSNCVDEPRSDMLRKGDGTGRSGIQNA